MALITQQLKEASLPPASSERKKLVVEPLASEHPLPPTQPASPTAGDIVQQLVTEMRSLREDNERLKAAMWTAQTQASTAIAEPPEEDYLVTVLYGYGKVRPHEKVFVDNFLFEGGIRQHVPWSVAKHWVKGTRPDGGIPVGRVHVQVLPDDATPADYIRAIGGEVSDVERTAAMLAASDLDQVFATMDQSTLKMMQARMSAHIKK